MAFDLAGVGIGPFNLSLAALADPLDLTTVFFDRKPEFSWHPGMLIEGTTLQVPFLADLVTLVDPTSHWSFLAYLRERDRMFPFYFAERFHVSRHEYDDYCRWVASSLPSCRFDAGVDEIAWDGSAFALTAGVTSVRARNVVLGVGTSPFVPESLRPLLGDVACHSSDYLPHAEAFTDTGDVTVVGSGQSGAEVFLDLLRRQREDGTVRWLTSSPAFAPMEYSKLGLEHFTPDYTAYFRSLPASTRDALVPSQWQLYKAVSADTLAAIHDELYERRVRGRHREPLLMPNVQVSRATRGATGVELSCVHTQQGSPFTVTTGRVVLATGYETRHPACLEPLAPLVDWDESGRYVVDGDHRVATHPQVTGGLYVQNAELHTHGVGTPDLGLGAYRAATVLNAVTGREAYRLPERTAFTRFGVPSPDDR